MVSIILPSILTRCRPVHYNTNKYYIHDLEYNIVLIINEHT